jgi:D-amino-acid dehydrogenase
MAGIAGFASLPSRDRGRTIAAEQETSSVRSAIVLGAGMVGIGTALHLQARGWSVLLVDRGPPGRETSYGNAGIVQSEAVEPYAMPRDFATLVAIACGASNDVRYDPRALRHHLGPLLRYWWHSSPKRHARQSRAYATLIAQAASEHESLIEAAGAGHLMRRGGFRLFHRDARAMDAAIADAARLRTEFGVRSQVLSSAELLRTEPNLKQGGAGAIHWLDPLSISDPGELVGAYAQLFVRRGGTVRSADAETLRPDGTGWRVETEDGVATAEAAVIALGPWSPALLRRYGYRIPMVRKRGYHRHWRSAKPPSLPLVDAAHGYVMAPMEKGLRITSGAELGAPDAEPTPLQLVRAEEAAQDLLDLGAPLENAPWFGTRPCMPDMLPVIGEAPRHPGLWFHFGHGHQGFTLGLASGRLLAEMMTGEAPFAPAEPFSARRL